MSDILQFNELRKSADGDSNLDLYETKLGARIFTYLYLRPSTCSLVWRTPSQFQFDCTLPIEFLDIQFTKKTPGQIKLAARSLPWDGVSIFHTSKLYEPYRLKKCLVTLVPTGEARLLEYDLSDPSSPDTNRYRAEIVQSDEAVATIAFGRFDFELGNDQVRRISYSLTVERFDDPAGLAWEFAINFPRDLELKDATLKWIVKHHFSREMHAMNFKESLAELHKMIKPQKEPVYV